MSVTQNTSTPEKLQDNVIVISGGGGGNSSSGPIASDGVVLPEGLAKTITFTNNNPTSITVVYNGNTYIQTFTYTSGNITAISQWVKQ